MTELVIATGNPGKLREFEAGLKGLVKVLSARALGVESFPKESGATYEENAFIKAAYVAHKLGLPSLADDSGLEVAALDSAPGVHSARYGGEMTDGERVAYLLKKIMNVPPEARQAKFVSSLVLATPAGEVRSFLGECHGVLLEGPRGKGGFGYDPIFFSPELGKTFSEATTAEKQSVSHRGRALAELRGWLQASGLQLLKR